MPSLQWKKSLVLKMNRFFRSNFNIDLDKKVTQIDYVQFHKYLGTIAVSFSNFTKCM